MDKHLSSAGYDLYEITQNEWILNVLNGPIYTGSFKKVAKYAIIKLGFELNEIEFAVKEMIAKDHNGAHFGMYGGFISTFQKEFKHVRQAS